MKLSRKLLRQVVSLAGLLMIALASFVYFTNLAVQNSSRGLIYDMNSAPKKQAALVLGARVWADGKMSDMFQDRVDMAVYLYNAGKVQKILVSGDHGTSNYDEVDTAKNYLLSKGISADDIFLDHAGFDTYDSVYRAKYIFQVQSIIVVSQKYHLPRALYIARKLDIDAVGVPADFRIYGGQQYRDLREIPADVKAWLDVMLKVKPKFLGVPVPITGDSLASWGDVSL